MSRLSERMNLARTVLKELSRQPLSRTELEQRTIRKAGTHASFEGIFRYLIVHGYAEKSEPIHRASYRITDKGVKLLEAIE